MEKALQVIENLIELAPPLVSFETAKVSRAIDLFKSFSLNQTRPIYLWSAGDGLHRMDASHILIPRTRSPEHLLDFIKSHRHSGVFLLPGFTGHLADARVVAQMKQVLDHDTNDRVVVLIDTAIEVPSLLKPYTRRVRYGQQAGQLKAG